MFSKSFITTSLLLSLLAPYTIVSAAPVGASTTTAELTTRARLPIRIVRDGLSIKVIRARDNLKQERPLSKREPQPGRNNISNPRNDILKGVLEKLGERKRDLAAADLETRDSSIEEELVERIFRGGRRSLDDEDTLNARNRLGIKLPNTGIRPSGGIGPGGRNPTSSPGPHSLKERVQRRLGERKRDLGAVVSEDIAARELVDEELVEREPIFGIVKNLFRGGRRDLEAFEDEFVAREWVGSLEELD
ncbi:hypothetical protein BKA70DRAFT_1427720 [Coprinopsis sp. MPI-PUGE-AT-0042]|nr:hypothetical protein BKA70DRAFT_1427720 [Coprinopsis sp. MPI-PUGE-AT-0042]